MADEKKSWKDAFTFLEPDGVTHAVGGEDIEFFPISLGTLFEIKQIAKPLAKALAILFNDKERDYGSINRNFHTPDGEKLDNELIIEPMSVDMAKLRQSQREDSIESLMESLLDTDAQKVIGKLIMESMKNRWDQIEKPSPLEFMKAIPAPTIVDFLTGVAKANKGVLGPLAETLTGLWTKVRTKIESAVSETEDEASNETEDTSESSGIDEKAA